MDQIFGASTAALSHLPSAAWDLAALLSNAKNYVESVGGLLLFLIGTVALIWGGVLAAKKLMGGQQHGGAGWGQIILLILIGGALATGGFALIQTIGSGAETTIKDLGGGTVMVQSLASLVGLG